MVTFPSIYVPAHLVLTQRNSVSCNGSLQIYTCINDSYICSLASLTSGIMGAYPCCYVMIGVHLCQVLVPDDKWTVQQFVSGHIICSYLFLFPASFWLLRWVNMGFGYLELSNPFLPLCKLFEIRLGLIDRRYFVPLQHWCVALFFCVILG